VLVTLVVLLAIISVPVIAVMAAVLYGSRAFGWGFHHYPKSAAMVAFVLIVALFVAALSFNRLFPGCNFTWGMFGGYSHCTPIR
jgi:hypothetical protein